MKTYTIQMELKSDALIGSGEGFGAIIDSDIVFDDFGIPYVPAKRIKGCLKDSANEVLHILIHPELIILKLQLMKPSATLVRKNQHLYIFPTY